MDNLFVHYCQNAEMDVGSEWRLGLLDGPGRYRGQCSRRVAQETPVYIEFISAEGVIRE